MRLFLVAFFTIYGGLHFYLYTRILEALVIGTGGKILLGLFFVLMVAAPVLWRLAERNEFDFWARLLAYTGFSWMGFAFLFFSLSIATDLYRLALWAPSAWVDLSSLAPSPRTRVLLSCVVAFCICLYGFYEALQIRTVNLTMVTEKLPPEKERFRLAVISDVHLGIMTGERRVSRMLEVVNRTKPDMLISLGDLVDGQRDHIEGTIALLEREKYPWGKYAVMGNHEYFVGIEHSLKATKEAGFTILRDEAVVIDNWLTLAGIDDPVGRRMGLAPPIDQAKLLGSLPRRNFTVVLKHQSLTDEASLHLFDLQLSGHAHGGQIFPFRILSRLFYAHIAGRYDLGKGAILYVSRGTGTWGPPIRFLAPPEVTLVDFVRPPAALKSP